MGARFALASRPWNRPRGPNKGVPRPSPAAAGRVGRGGARERAQFSPSGGNGDKRTLRRRWGGAEWRVQAFCPQDKTLAEGRLCRPEHFNPYGSPQNGTFCGPYSMAIITAALAGNWDFTASSLGGPPHRGPAFFRSARRGRRLFKKNSPSLKKILDYIPGGYPTLGV